MAGSGSFVLTFEEPQGAGVPGGQAEGRLTVSDLVRLGRRVSRRVAATARREDQVTFAQLIHRHVDVEPASLEVVQETWPAYDHVNVQAGLDHWLAGPGRTHEVIGVTNHRHREFGLTELMGWERSDLYGPAPGTVARVNLACGPDGESAACVVCAVYLVTQDDDCVVLLLRQGDGQTGQPRTSLEIAAEDPALATRIAAQVRAASVQQNVYRGQVVSFGTDMFGEREAVLAFRHRPTMPAESLVLPAETIEAVTRQVVGVARHREALLAAGQHLKRGLLLYGPPGVGKTHTVRYLTAQLTGTTTVLLSGDSLHMIEAACSVARTLQPAMIVIEDVDLIAEDRGDHPGHNPLLFQLLNEMDGLAEDCDVVFLLTTNRADVLEPALAQRPGRVDQAVALEHPDAAARARLFELYRGDLVVDTSRLAGVLARTEGVTASFLKELLRRAALRAAESTEPGDGSPLSVSADQLEDALGELLDSANAMTRVLLGHRLEEPA